MWEWLLDAIVQVGWYIYDAAAWAVGWFTGFLELLWTWFTDDIVTPTWNALTEWMQTNMNFDVAAELSWVTAIFQNQTITDTWDAVNYFIPIPHIIFWIFTGYATAIGVRIVRFICGYIPTIDG